MRFLRQIFQVFIAIFALIQRFASPGAPPASSGGTASPIPAPTATSSGPALSIDPDGAILAGSGITHGDSSGPLDNRGSGPVWFAIEFPTPVASSQLNLTFEGPPGTEIRLGIDGFYGEFSNNQGELITALTTPLTRDPYRGTGFHYETVRFTNHALVTNYTSDPRYKWNYPPGFVPYSNGLGVDSTTSTPHKKTIKQILQWPTLMKRVGWDSSNPSHWQSIHLGDAMVHGILVYLDGNITDYAVAPNDSIAVEISLQGVLLGQQTIKPYSPRRFLPEYFHSASLQGARVNLKSGALLHDITLFHCVGTGICTSMNLKYNSHGTRYWRATAAWPDQDEYVFTPFGHGWAGLYTLRILKEIKYKRDANGQPEKEEQLTFQDATGVRYRVISGSSLHGGLGEVNTTFGVLNEHIQFDDLPGGGYTLKSDFSPLVATFDSDGKLTELRHRNHGRPLTIAYQGSQITIMDSQGRLTRWQLDNGLVRQIIDPDNRTWKLQYSQKQLKTITRDNSPVYEFDYNPDNNQLTQIGGVEGLVTDIVYKTPGRTVDNVVEGNAMRSFVFNNQIDSAETTVEDSLNRSEIHEMTAGNWRVTSGNASQMRDQDISTGRLKVEYANPIGSLGAPNNTIYSHEYPNSIFRQNTHQIIHQYPSGVITELNISPSGFWVNSEINDEGDTIDYVPGYTLKAVGLIKEIHEPQFGSNPRGKTIFQHNEDGEVVKINYPNGDEDVFVRSPILGELGLIIKRSYRSGEITYIEEYEYNALGYLTAVVDYYGGRTVYKYDADKIDEISHPDNTRTNYQYDAKGRLEKIEYPDNRSIDYAYESALTTLIKTIDESGFGTTVFTRNSLGEITGVQSPDGGSEISVFEERKPANSIEALMPFWLGEREATSWWEERESPPSFTVDLPDVRVFGIPQLGDF